MFPDSSAHEQFASKGRTDIVGKWLVEVNSIQSVKAQVVPEWAALRLWG
jgi:hypothetical protein